MLNIEDVLARVLQRDEYRQFHPEDFILQTIPERLQPRRSKCGGL